MAHLDRSLPRRVEIGAVLRVDYETVKTPLDNGRTIRNNRREQPARYYDISLPTMVRTDPDYLELLDLYGDAGGNLHTFNLNVWHDDTLSTVVTVRFDTPLQITSLTGWLDHIDTFTLVEEESEGS